MGIYKNWIVCEALIPHVQVELRYKFERNRSRLQQIMFLNNAAYFDNAQGRYKPAEEMNRRALEETEKTLGKDHPDILTSVINLAIVLGYQGKYKTTEEMNRRALKGRKKMLRKDHSDTLTSVNNLAKVLRYQGKYEAAEEMNRRR